MEIYYMKIFFAKISKFEVAIVVVTTVAKTFANPEAAGSKQGQTVDFRANTTTT